MCAALLTGFASCSDDKTPDEPTPGDPTQLAKPTLVKGAVTADSFEITWGGVENAASYAYTVDEEAEASTTETRISRTGLEAATEYVVRVKAVSGNTALYADSEWAQISVKTAEDPGPGPVDEPFTLTIPEDELSAFSAHIYCSPLDKQATYYFDYMSKEEWESEDVGGADGIQTYMAELMEFLGALLGDGYPAILEDQLYFGDNDTVDDTHIEPETDYVAFAYGWGLDGSFTTDVVTKEFRTPAAGQSSATIAITFADIKDVSMEVTCTPDANVASYYQVFAETSVVDEYIAKYGKDDFITYVKSNGYKMDDIDVYVWDDLTPETSYTMALVGIDKQGNMFYTSNSASTIAEIIPDRVESELFTDLLGTWTGKQTIMDYDESSDSEFESESTFNVTIAASVDGSDRDYRGRNQLVALVEGYGGISYYDIAFLLENGFSQQEAEAAFGPKLLLDIAAGDVVTIDGTGKNTVYGWSKAGPVYLINTNYSSLKLDTGYNINVNVSADKNTLTISSPADLGEGYYPSLLYKAGGTWNVMLPGLSDIVLTRATPAAAPLRRSAISRSRSAVVLPDALRSNVKVADTQKVTGYDITRSTLAKWNNMTLREIKAMFRK